MRQQPLHFQQTTAKSSTNRVPSQSLQTPSFVMLSPKQKLISLTCHCDIERNNFQKDLDAKKDKNKILQIFREKIDEIGNKEVKFYVKFHKSMETVIQFSNQHIAAAYAMNASQGMLSFLLKMEQTQQKNIGVKQVSTNQQSVQVKVMLSAMEPTLVQELCKIIREVIGPKLQGWQIPQQQPQQQLQQQFNSNQNAVDMQSKKRKLDQITNPPKITNIRDKVRKLNDYPELNKSREAQQQISQSQQAQQELITKRKPISLLNSMPWDIINIILNYQSKLKLKDLYRVNRQFKKLVSKRKSGVKIQEKDIPNIVFFNVLEKSKLIQRFSIKTNKLAFISVPQFEKYSIQFPKLIELDLATYNDINETSLSRLIHGCTRTLQTLRISYQCFGLTRVSILAMSKLRNLKHLQIGDRDDYVTKMNPEFLSQFKKMLNIKRFSLVSLCLFNADADIINKLIIGEEAQTLVSLTIGKFNQFNKKQLTEMEGFNKLKTLQELILCPSYHSLEFEVLLPDEQNNQQIAVAGSRELELMLFNMKNTLKHLVIGQYAYNELLVYLAEICKNIERLEVNSDNVTDHGFTEVLRKMSQLKHLDIAACPNFSGIAFFEVEEFASKQLQKVILNLANYELQKVKAKLTLQVPQCVVELKMKKSYQLKN